VKVCVLAPRRILRESGQLWLALEPNNCHELGVVARLLSQLSLAHWLLDKIYHAAFKLCVIMVTYTACCNMQSSPAHCLLEYPDSMRVLDLQPDEAGSMISGVLREVRLSANSVYECMSYM
jgi:hypothetical protein